MHDYNGIPEASDEPADAALGPMRIRSHRGNREIGGTGMIRSASDLSGAEKTSIHPLIMSNLAVSDVAFALGRMRENALAEATTASNQPASSRQNRVEFATLGRRDQSIAVGFHEAKYFTDTVLRVRSKPPTAIGQLIGYQSTLVHHAMLVARYSAVSSAFVRLDATRRHVRSGATLTSFPVLGAVIREVASLGRSDRNLAICAADNSASTTGAFRTPALTEVRQPSHA